jgi:hypothetical protein
MHHDTQQSQAVTSSLSRSRKMMADQVTRMAAVAQLVGEQDQLLRYTLFTCLNFLCLIKETALNRTPE